MSTDVLARRLLTAREAAELLGVSPKTVHRLVAAGRLTPIRLVPGGRLRFVPEDVDRLIEFGWAVEGAGPSSPRGATQPRRERSWTMGDGLVISDTVCDSTDLDGEPTFREWVEEQLGGDASPADEDERDVTTEFDEDYARARARCRPGEHGAPLRLESCLGACPDRRGGHDRFLRLIDGTIEECPPLQLSFSLHWSSTVPGGPPSRQSGRRCRSDPDEHVSAVAAHSLTSDPGNCPARAAVRGVSVGDQQCESCDEEQYQRGRHAERMVELTGCVQSHRGQPEEQRERDEEHGEQDHQTRPSEAAGVREVDSSRFVASAAGASPELAAVLLCNNEIPTVVPRAVTTTARER
jgi:excisionase family DNA binding protein